MSKTIPFSSYNLQADLQDQNVTRCEMLDVILTTFVQHSCMAGHFKIKIKNTASSNMNKQGFCPTVMMCCFGYIFFCYFLHKWFPALLFITNINLADLNGKWCINMAPFKNDYHPVTHIFIHRWQRRPYNAPTCSSGAIRGSVSCSRTLWGNFWFPCGHSIPQSHCRRSTSSQLTACRLGIFGVGLI